MRNCLSIGCFGFVSFFIIRISKYTSETNRNRDFCTWKSIAKAKRNYLWNYFSKLLAERIALFVYTCQKIAS